MVTVHIREVYAQILEPLEQNVEEALRHLAIERANQHIAELQQKVRVWEEKYHCCFDLFAYRTATDEAFVMELNTDPDTQQWEADVMAWEFYATELNEWYKRLQSILTA
jgi:hypothetical protein